MKPRLEEREQQLRELLKQYVDKKSIAKLPQGWLIKPNAGISPVSLVLISQKMKELGATYSATTNTFTLKEIKRLGVQRGFILTRCIRLTANLMIENNIKVIV